MKIYKSFLILLLLTSSFVFPVGKEIVVTNKNLGNTCYINSILTLLLNSPLFIKAFEDHINNEKKIMKLGAKFIEGVPKKEFEKKVNTYNAYYEQTPTSFNYENFTKNFSSLIQEREKLKNVSKKESWGSYMWSYAQWFWGAPYHRVEVMKPKDFCFGLIQKMNALFGRQEDASEALGKILFLLVEKSHLNSRFFERLFSLKYDTSLMCSSCKKSRSSEEELLHMVPLSITGDSVQSCLNSYFNFETIENVECCNKNCSKQFGDHIKNKKITVLPDVLLVVLKRTICGSKKDAQGKDVYFISKKEAPVKINETLDVKKIVDPKFKKNPNYVLRSFVVHNGSSFNGGHYTAYYRGKDQWFYVNDESVDTNKSDCVKAFMQTGKSAIKDGNIYKGLGETPYIMLYERENIK